MVMALIPILVPFCVKLGRYASPLRRMTVGMALAGVSYLLVANLQQRIDSGEQLSVLHQLLPYLVLTTAEVLVSTTGLEFAFTQAPERLKSVITGLWQFTVAIGNILVVVVTQAGANAEGDAAATPERFRFYAWLVFGVAICFGVISQFYKYRTASAAPSQLATT